MALPTNLTTNEVKNSAGTEVEFIRSSAGDHSLEFLSGTVVPAYPHTIKLSHSESGTGTNKRRRSVLRVDMASQGEVDTTVVIRDSAYIVADFAVGNHNAVTDQANVLAELMSLFASLGASTTILYDCSGYGAAALLYGTS